MTEQEKPLWWRRLQALEACPGASPAETDARPASPQASPVGGPAQDADAEARLTHEQVLTWLSQARLRDAREPKMLGH